LLREGRVLVGEDRRGLRQVPIGLADPVDRVGLAEELERVVRIGRAPGGDDPDERPVGVHQGPPLTPGFTAALVYISSQRPTPSPSGAGVREDTIPAVRVPVPWSLRPNAMPMANV
jgi:hypothetical protein